MIKVDENTCIGCGACTYVDSNTFAMSDKGVSTVISQEITDKAKEAAAACPIGAIIVESENNSSEEETDIQAAA